MVYLDHNATTPVRPEVRDAMLPFLSGEFGNPNSPYFLGQRSRKAVEQAREKVAALLNAQPGEIVFTSCGSESDVMAIAGAAWAAFDESKGAKKRIVTSRIEHDAVRGLMSVLARRGFAIDWLGVDKDGTVDLEQARKVIGPETALVSVMHANNEVGTIQPIEELAKLCKDQGVLLHTDAVQSAGKSPLDVRALGVDLLSISGHKLNAPKGIGALFVKNGLRLAPTITGHQEKNRRGGTENVSAIAGLGVACELALKELPSISKYEAWRAKLISEVTKLPDVRVNGHATKRLPNCAHVSFKGLDGFQLVVALDQKGVCVSSGPACSSGSSEPSHVLEAMGVSREWSTGSIRVSFGYGNTEQDLTVLLDCLREAVPRLRKVSLAA
jgi:cysteine desulfurase